MNSRIGTIALVLLVAALTVAWILNTDARLEPRSADHVAPAMEVPSLQQTRTDGLVAQRSAITSETTVSDASARLAFIGRVEDDAGQPIEGVRVELQAPSARGRTIAAATATLADGSFVLPAEQAIAGTLQFVAREHVDVTRPFVLPGEFLVVRLARGFAIAGRVVERGDRTPVADAIVVRNPMLPEATFLAGPRLGASAFVRTDADGRFAIVAPRLPALLRAQTRGRGTGYALITSIEDSNEIELSGDPSDATPFFRLVDRETKAAVEEGVASDRGPAVRCAPGLLRAPAAGWGTIGFDAPGYLRREFERDWGDAQRTGVDAEHAYLVELAPATAIAGTLIDDQGQAIEGAVVFVRLDDAPLREVDKGSAFKESRTRSDRTGRFVVEDVPIGARLRLRAEHAGVVVADKRGIEIASRDPFDCGILKSEAGPETLELAVVRASGEPAVGAIVRGAGEARVRVCPTDEHGIARFEHAARIRQVVASAAESAPNWSAVEWTSRDVRVQLVLGVPGHIGGVVRDAAGAAFPDAFVMLDFNTIEPGLNALLTELGDQSPAPGREVTKTDATGRFAFDGLRIGNYRLNAFQPDLSLNILGGPRGLPRPVDVQTGRDDVELVLTATGAIALHVTERDTRRACDRFSVSIRGVNAGYQTAIIDTNGYASQGMIAGEPIRIRIESAGFSPRALELPPLAPFEVRLVEIELDRGAQLRGTARFTNGSSAAFARISTQVNGHFFEGGFAAADANGVFAIANLQEGEHTLTVQASSTGSDDEQLPMIVEPALVVLIFGETRQQDLRLTSADSGPLDLTFDVQETPAGTETKSIEVWLESNGRIEAHRTTVQHRQPWQIPGLPAGTYNVSTSVTLRTRADGSQRRVTGTCEPATIDVTREPMAVTVTLRAK